MFNDDNNINRPRFDEKTGEPIHYDDEVKDTVDETAQAAATEEASYRYSKEEIPFNRTAGTAYTDNASYTGNNSYADNASYTDNASYANNNSYTGNTSYANNASYTGNASYANNASYAGNTSYAKPKKEKKAKKERNGSFVNKALKLVGSAAVFGLVAGIVMYGVYYTGVTVLPNNTNSNYDISTVTSNVNTTSAAADSSATFVGMDTQNVASAALPAMVALTGTKTVSSSSSSYYGLFGDQSYEAQTSGTGIIVGKNDTELLIVTNAHVVDSVNDLTCVFVDDESVSATVKGSKSDKDIAVVAVKLSDIKSSTIESISIAELADDDDLAVGQEVVAIGNALGEGQSVTNGIISAMDRSITVNNVTFTGLIMTNAAINSGNSGGALLNSEGKVIAINFAKTSSDGVEGMAYSIPISNVKDIIDTLMNRETRTKVSTSQSSYLGIVGMDITSSISSSYGFPQGVVIRSVESGSPADNAGLSLYDIIVGFDDQTVSSMSGLQSIMEYYAAGETVTIEYYHPEGNQYVLKSVQVTLGQK
jgi:serine protease Do